MKSFPEEDLTLLLRGARERNRPYKAPPVDELRHTLIAGHTLLKEALSERSYHADRMCGAAHFELARTRLGGAPAIAVREDPLHRRGGGVYIFRRGAVPRERLVQIPHSFFDVGTLELGVELAEAAPARALFVNTVHRFQGGRPQPGEDDQPVDAPADLAHQAQTFFQSFTLAALAALPHLQVVQLHGFADGGVPECPQALTVVSPGVAPAGAAEAAQVAARLAALLGPDKVLLYPRDTRCFGAQRNVQGRAVAADGRATFLHVELSHTLRTRLSDDGALRRAFIAAVIGGGAQ